LKEVRVFNLGAEKLYKVLEIIRYIEPVTGQPLVLEFVSMRLGFTASVYADSSLAREILLWKAKIPEVIKAIEHVLAWKTKTRDEVK